MDEDKTRDDYVDNETKRGSNNYDPSFNMQSNQDDIDTINSRSTSDTSLKGVVDNNTSNESTRGKSSLEEKEGLEEKSKIEESDKPKTEESNKSNKGSFAKNALENASGITKLKNEFLALKLKIKIAIIIAAVSAGLLLVLMVFISIFYLFDTFTNAVTNYFGVPEVDNEELDGIYTSEEYQYDENGNELTDEQLVVKLKGDDNCSVTVWKTIGDFFKGDDFGGDPCSFMRYIRKRTDKEGSNVDRSLVISTIYYGFASQPSNSQYKNVGSIPRDTIDAMEHYESLRAVLRENRAFINKDKVDDIINNSKTSDGFYYKWSVNATEKDSEGRATAKVGTCVKQELSDSTYDLKKWEIFMRFGYDAAEAYDDIVTLKKAYESSSDECKGELSDNELLQRVVGASVGSQAYDISSSFDVTEAKNALSSYSDLSTSAFEQSADVKSKTKDIFNSYNGIEFDYKNGFAYNYFPGYKRAEDDPNIEIEYDDVYTPKEIETVIQNIIDRKKDINGALLFEDPDNPEPKKRSNSSVARGTCGNYLTTPISNINVELTDCYGSKLATVDFKDYIMGVAAAEVGFESDEWIKAQMVAAISYSLNRHNNYAKGETIRMRSGTCDQAYCSLKEGCYVVRTPLSGCAICDSFYIGGSRGKYPNEYSRFAALYEEAAGYLLVNNGKVATAGYINTVQNTWKRYIDQGMPFTEALQRYYTSDELINCTDLDGNSSSSSGGTGYSSDRPGSDAEEDYPKVAPDKGNYHGFSYSEDSDMVHININPTWKEENLTTIKPNCSVSEFANKEFIVNKNASTYYQKAFDGICKLLTDGVTISDGSTCKYNMSDLLDGSTFVEKKNSGYLDLYSYGLAQSWNYSARYNIGGNTYYPYKNRSLKEYEDFIQSLGGEEKCQNVNYILWKYAYKDSGFNWGGNYGRNGASGTFDGKLFEINYGKEE